MDLGTPTPRRELLHQKFIDMTANPYFQAPSNTQMTYPAIRYQIDGEQRQHADNIPFFKSWRYEVILITRDPDDGIKESLSDLPKCSFERHYVVDDLHHYVFNLFF